MAGTIPSARFRLPQTFSISPELSCDDGPEKGLIIGQNAPNRAFEAIYLGKHAEAPHKDVWMDIRGAHVLYVMGKRRSGKSYTLGAIAEGLVSKNWIRQGTTEPAVLILDTMNVFLTMPYTVTDTFKDDNADVKELRKWKLEGEALPLTLYAPAGSSIPSEVTSETLTLRASDLSPEEWCGLFEVDPFVDPLGHLINTLHAKVAVEGWTNKNSAREVKPKPYFAIGDLLLALEGDRDIEGFQRDTKLALRRRLEALQRLPLFSEEGLDIRRLLKGGAVSVLLLRDLDPEMRAVMVSLITKRMMKLRGISEQQERMIPIHRARMEKYKVSDPDRAQEEADLLAVCEKEAENGLPRSWLLIDEAHNYIPARTNVASRKPLKKYVDEGRNLGLSIVVATQQPSGLDPSIQRNADMLLIHALSHHDDISAAQGMVNTAYPDEVVIDGKYRISGTRSFETIVRNLPLGYAMVSTDRANRLFPTRIRPRSTVHGGADY